MTITQEQYNKMVKTILGTERESLDGFRAQTYFDPVSGRIWLAHLSENDRYPHGGKYIVIYAVEPWENKLKDLYEDENSDVNWDDENYKFTPEYKAFYNWYFDDNADGFRVYEILDEALERNGITVEE